MQLISEAYRAQNAALHEARPDYGASSGRWSGLVTGLAEWFSAESILDYGCGKGLLRQALGPMVREYDPAIPGKDAAPQPADLVVSTDVLEHIEPECLTPVLGDIQRLARKAAFLSIALRPAAKRLPDGRNAHLIVESGRWWLDRLDPLFARHATRESFGELLFIGVPR